MRYTDIAIIGGGLAGSAAAAMLGRTGIAAVLVDPHEVYPPDFRVEKLGGEAQLARFRATGLADSVLRKATLAGENWIARFGCVLDKDPSPQYGILYDALVNALREEIPPEVERIVAKAVAVSPSEDRQSVFLSNGETISARLVVLANGLNVGLRHALGIVRRIESAAHSISIGFDIAPLGRSSFPFPAMTYFQERARTRVPYITLFPLRDRMRANLFAYREVGDPWLRAVRRTPVAALDAVLPGFRRVAGDYAVTGEVKVRPADLYVTAGHRQPGLVLVGDAFAATCPVTGTGSDKVFTDVARLCNVYIPQWLASGGMGEAKIAAFYADPLKRACDAWSMRKAWQFKSVSVELGPYWLAQRWARFGVSLGRGLKHRLARVNPSAGGAHSSSSSSSSSSLSPSA
ncbi:FAD-dependent monooxygenase [Bradyrhizobium sp. STM 3557]|uniref:FAD-dependent monooxygenase n=1 Tax=Bradyrhizobium sp. STM 3557 TaxID=578920 RepID=UPI00388E80ED